MRVTKLRNRIIALFIVLCIAAPTIGTALSVAAAERADWRVVYSLNDDFNVQIREQGSSFSSWDILRNAGSPIFTAVAHPVRGNSIQVSGRAQGWYTVDLFGGIFNFEENNYHITIRGRVAGDATLVLGGVGSPWNSLEPTAPAANGAFELAMYLNMAFLEDTDGGFDQFINGFRIATQCTSDFIIDDIIVLTDGAYTGPQFPLDLPSMREYFAPYFILGAAWGSPGEKDANFREFYAQHFASITAGNHHKPDFISRTPAGWSTPTPPPPQYWDFAMADYFVDWAEANDILMIGHTLAWHAQSPPWLTGGVPNFPNIPLATREQAMENMRMYIETVATRYAGRIHSWDVLNEIFTHAGTWGGANMNTHPDWQFHLRNEARGGLADNNLRWYDAFANGADPEAGESGSDFVFYAFYFARRYDPYAILYYNDYGETWYQKSRAIAAMIMDVNERWRNHPSYDGRLLIEAMGMQAHYSNELNFDLLSGAMDRYIATGVHISLTEMDIGATTQGRAVTEADFARQAYVFARVIRYAMERHEHVHRVTFWSLIDNDSVFWRYGEYANMFDTYRQPKTAFWEVMNLVTDVDPALLLPREEEPEPETTPPTEAPTDPLPHHPPPPQNETARETPTPRETAPHKKGVWAAV
ncbi:MAG: endo-1,4-beta-xylanase, partial [Defluviitaleaceae bacterium]|nr:endo-1,4-beta-xylanase [Defluviitaleaceae bacterium]